MALEQIAAITSLVTELPKLISGVRDLSSSVSKAVDEAYSGLESMREGGTGK